MPRTHMHALCLALALDADLEQLRRESIETRRSLARIVMLEGVASMAVGGALMIPDSNDLAWRYAGIHTAAFGVINTVVGVYALNGIAKEESRWDALPAAERPRHGVIDERGESVSHAINLGLDFAYLGVGATAFIASYAGVDHPSRWRAAGVAIGAQAVFLGFIDVIGLSRSRRYHAAFLEHIAPTVSFTERGVAFGAATSW